MQQLPDPTFTPEQEVLLWAIRADHVMDQRVAGILTVGINWEYVRKTAVQHGIIPLLYQRLKREMAEIVPPDELVALKILFQENAVRNIRMTHHLFKVLDLLAGSGVAAIPFKGPALAVQAYGDLSMRRFRDLDILIHEDDIDLVCRILNGQGAILITPGQMNIERWFGFLDQKDLTLKFQGDILELHWKFIERYRAVPLDMKEIWGRTAPVEFNGRKLAAVSPEDMILLLCYHGHKHGWQDLGWLADLICLFSRHPHVNWHDIFVRSENLGLKRIVLTSLFLAHKYGGTLCDPEFDNLLTSDTTVHGLARELQLDFFRSRTLAISPFFYLKSRERFRDQAMYLLFYSANRVLVFIRWLIRPFTRIRAGSSENGAE